LRPQNPDSLFQDRARLIWDERRQQICVQFPAVKKDILPATWHLGERSQSAAQNPDELVLNSDAFQGRLLLTLQCAHHRETQRLRGLEPWGLFDTESGGRLINPHRDDLPLKSYVVVSQDKIASLAREGFDEDENPINERFELADKTTCFITRLWPTRNHAELRVKGRDDSAKIIRFRTRSKIEARVFVGSGCKAAYFSRDSEKGIKIVHLPILCVAIPEGYFKDDKAELARTFKVFVDGKSAAGEWEHSGVRELTDSEFYYWRWNRKPFLERKPGVDRLTDLAQLGGAFRSPDLRGNRIISVEAMPHICVRFDVELVTRSGGQIDIAWGNLPGAFLPMFLLCQSSDGMKWEDLVLAKDVIAPRLRFSPYILHKYAEHGFLVLRGRRWMIRESRAELIAVDGNQCELKYCGDPSILWGLYRHMYHDTQGSGPPVIEVLQRSGGLPYLRMVWPLRLRSRLDSYLRRRGIVISGSLWTH